MAITEHGTSTAGGATASSLTFAHDNGTANFMTLAIGLGYQDSDNTPSTVTYNASAMTQIGSWVGVKNKRVALYYIENPSSGSNNVVIDGFTSGSHVIAAVATSWTGVDVGGTPVGTSNSATGTSTGPTVDVTSAIGEVVVDACIATNLAVSVTLTDDETQELGTKYQGTPDSIAVRLSTSEEDGSTTTTCSWTLSTSKEWKLIGAPLKPASTISGDIVTVYYNDIDT